jgi:two-component system sensor histidine kinase RstB
MIKLYLKTITLVIVVSLLVLSANQFVYSYLTTKGFNHINRILSTGTFSYIQKILAKTPRADWNYILKKIQPSDAPLAKIVPIKYLQHNKALKLGRKDQGDLLDGKIVITTGLQIHYAYFLYYGLFETYAFQRIGNSDLALNIMLSEPVNQIIKSTMRWISHITLLELENTPKKKRSMTLERLQERFGIPLQLISTNSKLLTNKIRQDIRIYGVAYSFPKIDSSIKTLYFSTADPTKLLVVGPTPYRMVSTLFSIETHYYFIVLFIAALLIVAFLTWIFSRNVLNIYKITKRYSVGDFRQHAKVGRFSILHASYENVVLMGNSLKRLIQSQKNMSRFVAHEVRTPLSTMQLALDSLQKEKNLSESAKRKLNSIQEDVVDINTLIGYFLLYYKAASHELKAKHEMLNICSWLDNTVKKYELSKINVTLNLPKQESIMVNFDANLLKHVVDNLIVNALKFAIKDVRVGLEANRDCVEIYVEDDGPGISALEVKNIFQPFATLNTDQDLCKHIGLGLTIVKSIIELHDGSIDVSESSQLGGAKFIVKLPK